MSNIIMAIFMALTLLFLAPLFSNTPLVALSAIIMSAMLGLINYTEIIHLFKVDKFDFCICMAAFCGVVFVSMDVGLMLSVSRALSFRRTLINLDLLSKFISLSTHVVDTSCIRQRILSWRAWGLKLINFKCNFLYLFGKIFRWVLVY